MAEKIQDTARSEKEQKDQQFRKDLNNLGDTVSRLKDISEQIGQELDDQGEMIDELDQKVEESNSKLKKTNRKVNKLIKSKTCVLL